LSRNLGVCNESFSYEYSHIIPDHETLFDVFPFDDTLFKIHFERDHVIFDELLLEEESHEEKITDLHGISSHIILPHGHPKESEKEDLGDDVASCNFHF